MYKKFVHSAQVWNSGTVTHASTISLEVSGGEDIRAAWTMTAAETINLTGTLVPGARLTLVLAQDSSGPYMITFGSGFSSAGTYTPGVASRVAVVEFLSNGTKFYEIARNNLAP